jgi:hypothetical protein
VVNNTGESTVIRILQERASSPWSYTAPCTGKRQRLNITFLLVQEEYSIFLGKVPDEWQLFAICLWLVFFQGGEFRRKPMTNNPTNSPKAKSEAKPYQQNRVECDCKN